MTEWNPKTEQLIREASEFAFKTFSEVLDPNIGTARTITHLFNQRAAAEDIYGRVTNELGVDLRKDWQGGIKKIIALADANNSDAADKLKKIVPVAQQLVDEFGFTPDTKMGPIKATMTLNKIKKKGYKL